VSWDVEYTDPFGLWWETLTEGAQDAIEFVCSKSAGHSWGIRTARMFVVRDTGICVNCESSIGASRTESCTRSTLGVR
jgi:hypothetical protein